jgi:hypothetical protein
VFNRLFDPKDHHRQEILVVGGGDSAIETAIALAECENHVALSYRKADFTRPKEGNLKKLESLASRGQITLLMQSGIKEIRPSEVVLETREGERTLPNNAVYTMIGRELPLDFFRRSKVRLRGQWSTERKLLLALSLLFSGVIYFGKKWAPSLVFEDQAESLTEVFSAVFTASFWQQVPLMPARIVETSQDWSTLVTNMAAYGSLIGTIGLGGWAFVHFARRATEYFRNSWTVFKYSYFALAMILFCTVYFGNKYFAYDLLGKSPGFWYSFLYTLTILTFGLRRMYVKPTRYIKLQTWTLILVQAIPLFLLPSIILPLLWKGGMLPQWMIENLFPPYSSGGDPTFWRASGLILAWPLFISNVVSNSPTTVWLVLSLLQTFVVVPLIVVKWGKGAYCGWICSCGALAETLDDE